MTILPKKKQNKQSSSNEDDRENESDRYGYVTHSTSQNPGNNGPQMSPNNRSGWSTRADDKRSTPESGHATIGPSHQKRRHRTARVVDRDVVNSDLSRSLINSVRSLNKTPFPNSPPSNSPRNSLENDPKNGNVPACSSNGRVDDQERKHPASLLVPVNFGNSASNIEEDFSGYNSGDEYRKSDENLSQSEWEEKERNFERSIRKEGFNIKKMSEDGACLFRAVADQVYGDQEMHSLVRKLCMDYMEKNGDYFSQYVTENFADYVQRKRSDHIHGNHVEIQALSEIFNRPIHVYHYSTDPINIQNCEKTDNEPIRLSYHRKSHYNSVVDPFKATIGVGLGLPSFKPGYAENSLMEKALLISEQHELEQAMLQDKIRATDWEATNEAIEEQVARESYMEWLRENERRSAVKSSATSTLTNNNVDDQPHYSGCGNPSPKLSYSPRSSKTSPGRSSPKRCSNINNISINQNLEITNKNENNNKNWSSASFQAPNIDATSSFLHEVPPSVFGLRNWEETDPLMVQALAQSQAEYLDSLKRRNSGANNNSSEQEQNTSHVETDYTRLPSTSSQYF